MTGRHKTAIATSVGMAALVAAGAARAGGCQTCKPTPPPCNCAVPPYHQVTVPGVVITPPSVYVNVDVQAVAVAAASASASASASANSQSSSAASAYSNALANAQANALGAIYNGGGGSSWSASEGPSGYIPNLDVEGGEAKRICAEFRSVAAMTAVQAQCLDDKDIPHPASQVRPERDVATAYDGEVYRCIAGTRMQYTLADFRGQASFDHGRTVACAKGEALYHSAAGILACRPQKPARDCNERSLLRRFGAGIKVVSLSQAQRCVAYRTESASAAGGSLVLDGGVGGVVR